MLTLWFLMLILCSATVVTMCYPLIRGQKTRDASSEEKVVYLDQINEVERDLAAGSIAEPEAKLAKAEILRRLEAASRYETAPRPLSDKWRLIAFVATAALVILGGVNLYAYLGSPEMPSATRAAVPQQQAAKPSADSAAVADQVDGMIAKLKDRLKSEPNNADGWRMLGWSLFNTQKYQEAADAYDKAVVLDPDNLNYKSAEAEAIVQASQGVVTPKAQELLNSVLVKDPKDQRSRFYDALGHEQAGDQQGALDRWSSLLADAPADAPWREDVKARVANLGKALGKDVSAAVNVAPAPDQMEMIKGMVQKLADRLQTDPNDLDGWMKLMRSYQVLHDADKAKAAYANAQKVFTGDQTSLDKLKTAATELGID